ncbi:MAG: serine hydrolase, partial [Pseudomonadota bacterium]
MLRPRWPLICIALAGALTAPFQAGAQNQSADLENSFDSAFGTEMRSPTTFEAIYASNFEEQIAELADGSRGRIGVYAIDLATGEEVSVLADMR